VQPQQGGKGTGGADQLIALGEADYPAPLAALADAPPILSVLGKPDLLTQRIIAMVGARNGSANGVRFAEKLARDLGAAGLIIASGLARGLDAAAHRSALKSGTIAVLAGGVDIIYPRENTALYHDIIASGAVISEQPWGMQPTARHFPHRNRIVSGLALGTVVVEATLRSGSLITARLAGEQGREVLAVPGNPLDPRSQGTNGLIRDGATLIQSADDVLEALAPQLGAPLAAPLPPGLSCRHS
jgi:DNA processing protein